MATFNGVTIFGTDVVITPQANPREEQRDGFFGISGVERKDGGSRGWVLRVSGRHSGSNLALFVASQALFASYHDGRPYTLVDTAGRTWLNVKLTRFIPKGQILTSTDGQRHQLYEAEFEAPL